MIQHHVPRSYLRPWSFGDEEICVLDAEGQVRVMPLGLAGASVDGYTVFQTDGSRDDTIEINRLGPVDDGGATTIRSMLKHGLPRGARQQRQFARFVGWFILRGPVLASVSARVSDNLSARRAAGQLDEQHDVLGATGLGRGGKRLALPAGPFNFDRNDELELLRRGRAADAIGEEVLRRAPYWHLHRLGAPLLHTCDNPVVFEDEVAESPELASAVFLPLAPDAVFTIGMPYAPLPDALGLEDGDLADRLNALIEASAIHQRYCLPSLL